jgi:hypothetical protein
MGRSRKQCKSPEKEPGRWEPDSATEGHGHWGDAESFSDLNGFTSFRCFLAAWGLKWGLHRFGGHKVLGT